MTCGNAQRGVDITDGIFNVRCQLRRRAGAPAGETRRTVRSQFTPACGSRPSTRAPRKSPMPAAATSPAARKLARRSTTRSRTRCRKASCSTSPERLEGRGERGRAGVGRRRGIEFGDIGLGSPLPIARRTRTCIARWGTHSSGATDEISGEAGFRIGRGAAALPVLPRIAPAQVTCLRPIMIVVPFPAGGSTIHRATSSSKTARITRPDDCHRERRRRPWQYRCWPRRRRRARRSHLESGQWDTHVANGPRTICRMIAERLRAHRVDLKQSVSYPARKDMPGDGLKGLIAWLKAGPDKASAAMPTRGRSRRHPFPES